MCDLPSFIYCKFSVITIPAYMIETKYNTVCHSVKTQDSNLCVEQLSAERIFTAFVSVIIFEHVPVVKISLIQRYF